MIGTIDIKAFRFLIFKTHTTKMQKLPKALPQIKKYFNNWFLIFIQAIIYLTNNHDQTAIACYFNV